MNSEYTVTLSSKGQLTLPAEVRRRLQVGRAGKLRELRPWHEMRELAREDHVAEVLRKQGE